MLDVRREDLGQERKTSVVPGAFRRGRDCGNCPGVVCCPGCSSQVPRLGAPWFARKIAWEGGGAIYGGRQSCACLFYTHDPFYGDLDLCRQ